jgi:aspartate aminotransferase-like enzyme
MSYTAPGSFTGDPAKGSLAEYSVVYTDRAINLMAAPFGQVMRDISSNLKHVYSAQHVAVIPGSGSYGMEAVARQFGWKKEVLVIRNGYFSYRWSDIFHVCDIPKADGETVLKAGVVADAGTVKQPQFGPQSLDDVLAAISEKQPAAVFAPHVETSTGIILSDAYLTAVASAVHAYGGVFVVDSIASGNIWVDMAATGVDVLISAPQKGWSGPACCGLVMLSDHGRQVSDATASSSFCCNLGKWLTVMDKYESGGFMYYTTLPTDSLTAFRDVMLEARAYGYDKCKERQLELGAKVRAALEARGYRSVAAEGFKAVRV